MGEWSWFSFVAGAGLTWVLLLLVTIVDWAVDRFAGSDDDDPLAETAGRIELIDLT